jgi:hypothetical protein
VGAEIAFADQPRRSVANPLTTDAATESIAAEERTGRGVLVDARVGGYWPFAVDDGAAELTVAMLAHA